MGTLIPVVFRFPGRLAPGASRVTLAGSFNRWDPHSHPLTRRPGGDWATTIYLPPGRVVYCFYVDGAFWLDPDDDGRVSNSWGSEYSLRLISPDATPPRMESA